MTNILYFFLPSSARLWVVFNWTLVNRFVVSLYPYTKHSCMLSLSTAGEEIRKQSPPEGAQPVSSITSCSNFYKMPASVHRQLSSLRQIWGLKCTDIIITRNTSQAPFLALVRPFLNHKVQSLSHF